MMMALWKLCEAPVWIAAPLQGIRGSRPVPAALGGFRNSGSFHRQTQARESGGRFLADIPPVPRLGAIAVVFTVIAEDPQHLGDLAPAVVPFQVQ